MQSNSDDMECKYCFHQFTIRRHFENHVCDGMRREEIMQTSAGMLAHDLYNEWLIAQQRPLIDQVTFTRTKLFTTFVKFALLTRKCNYPLLRTFVKWAYKRNYLPVVWSRNTVYVEYLEYIDNTDYEKQAVSSAQWITRKCEDMGCDTSEFYDYVDPIDVVIAVQQRKVFPIFLIATTGFATMLTKLNQLNRAQIDAIVRVDRLSAVIKDKAHLYKQIQDIAEAMNMR